MPDHITTTHVEVSLTNPDGSKAPLQRHASHAAVNDFLTYCSPPLESARSFANAGDAMGESNVGLLQPLGINDLSPAENACEVRNPRFLGRRRALCKNHCNGKRKRPPKPIWLTMVNLGRISERRGCALYIRFYKLGNSVGITFRRRANRITGATPQK